MKRDGRIWSKSKKLDWNEVWDVAGTPIIPLSRTNTLPEILCPQCDNPLTFLISFL